MDLLTWIIVGLVAGIGASLIVGSAGYGLLGDMVVGMAGAILGGWVFREAHWHAPMSGVAGSVVVAFVGALLVLLALRFFHRGTRRSRL